MYRSMLAFALLLSVENMTVHGVSAQITETKVLPGDGAAGDLFGFSVSISGDYLVAAATGDDDDGVNSGSVYIFHRDETSWSQAAKVTASDAAAEDYFGFSVSVAGDVLLVGAPWDDDNGAFSGSAYVFRRDGILWVEEAKLTAGNGDVSDQFGYSTSISGDYALVGSPFNDDPNGYFSGSAYIFRREGPLWVQETMLWASDGNVFDEFGESVSISGDYAFVGANNHDENGEHSGAVYVFHHEENNWIQVAKLAASDGAPYDGFGSAVAISGDVALISAGGDDDNGTTSGSAYVFRRHETLWVEEAKLTANDGVEFDGFGASVSISADYAVVGAHHHDENGENSGAAYMFHREETNWIQIAKLTPIDGAEDDRFGIAVSMSGDYFVAGAYQNDDSGDNSGSAYVYSGVTSLPPLQVVQVNPEEGALITTDSTRLIWNLGAPGVDRYWVEISADSLFMGSFIDSTVTDTGYTVNPLIHNQTFWWKARAHNEFGWGPFSEHWTFFVYQEIPDTPVLASPDSSASDVSINPTLLWDPSVGTEYYRLQLSETMDFTSLTVDEDSISAFSFGVLNLSVVTTYYWRVNAANDLGTSAWSGAWSFTTGLPLPAGVQLLEPENNAFINSDSVFFVWRNQLVLIDRYSFEYDVDPLFPSPVVDSTLTDTTTTIRQLEWGQYWWRVRAHNASGWGPYGLSRVLTLGQTSVEEVPETPTEFGLSLNYPNPFNPSTTIEYALPRSSYVKIEVFNVLGERVSVLRDGVQDAGYHSVVFEAVGLPSGIYFYRLNAGDFVETKKLVLMR